MDDLSAHETGGVRELIEARGCEPWGSCRPTLARPQPHRGGLQQGHKARLRKAAARTREARTREARTREARTREARTREARTREALVEAMGEALRAVTPRDAEGWFAHCGYGPAAQHS